MRSRIFWVMLWGSLLGLLAVTPCEAQARYRRSRSDYYYPQSTYYSSSMYSQSYGYQPSDSKSRYMAAVDVAIYDNYFQPGTNTIPPGTTVRWTNYGHHGHTITSNDGVWDSGDVGPRMGYSVTFYRPGTYHYYCRYHAKDQMRGTISVREGAASPAAGGGYGGSSGY